jgi:hypothetical protein
MCVVEGVQGKPRSLGSLWAGLVARYLSMSSMNPHACDVFIPRMLCGDPTALRDVYGFNATSGSGDDGKTTSITALALDSRDKRGEWDRAFHERNGAFMHEYSHDPSRRPSPGAALDVALDAARWGARTVVYTDGFPVALLPVTLTRRDGRVAPKTAVLTEDGKATVCCRAAGFPTSVTLKHPDVAGFGMVCLETLPGADAQLPLDSQMDIEAILVFLRGIVTSQRPRRKLASQRRLETAVLARRL